MYNFGKIPPRAIQASGVASVLGEDCRVFYDNLFSSAGLGRVSDLLSARLRVYQPDELKLRAVLLFGFFEAYRAESASDGLTEPLVIECGLDDEKVAVGVTFRLNSPDDFKAEGLQERVSQKRSNSAFELLLSMIDQSADHVIVRWDRAQCRVEVISLLAIPGKIQLGERQPFTLVELPEAHVAVPAKEYIQLADLEYAELLNDNPQLANKKAAYSTGEILSKRFSVSKQEDTSEVRISGRAQAESDERIRVAGAKEAVTDNSMVRVSGGNDSKADDAKSLGFSVQAMLGKMWPFKRKNKEDGTEDQATAQPEASVVASAQSVAPEQPLIEKADVEATSPEVHAGEVDESDPRAMAQHLANNLMSGNFSKVIERAHEMAREIKRDAGDEATKRWVEGVSQQLMAEKVRLVNLSQKITQAMRQKEQDFRGREQKFAEDLRRKEEALHQKSSALSRSKEQIAQLSAQLERQKGAKGVHGEEGNFKQKYQLSQRMLTGLREENAKLASRIEEVKSASAASQKAAESAAQVELANLKTKQDQMTRQNMQLKSLNEQLMRRMNQSATKANEKSDRGPIDELKRKYETASKLSEQQQKEVVQLKSKLDKLSKEESRLLTDFAKKESELKRAKAELERLQAQVNAEKKTEKKAG